jgi:AcrR family transcriptional regulator
MARGEATDGSDDRPSTTLRSQHVEATRRAVLASARTLFGSQGYAQTSVDQIAAAARVTKGAVYHHFASKEALFRAVYEEVEAEAQARAASVVDPKGSPIEQIVARVDAYLDAALDEQIRRITLIDGPAVIGLDPETPADQQPGHVSMRLFVAAAVERGQIIDVDPDLLVYLVRGLALLGGLLIGRATEPDAARAELGHAVDAMLRGLAPKKKR